MPSALVTGGSSGIGLAIARMLRDEGYDLTLAARKRDRLQAAAAELQAHAVQADVSREEDCARLVESHRDAHGSLDVLVNSAGLGIAGTVPTPGLAAYGAAKAAVIALTRTLVREEASSGVRATALCPGFVDTPMAAWTGIAGEEMIQPEDCAELVRALLRLSPHARVPLVVLERAGDAV